ncbi:MAG: hypothetical protein DRH06_10530 [Deltaproteobacteria bacterium]|nr:MAG: hypothetical protein DRH06_10530 [Deltaproteobacteria bacterium]
MTIEELARFDGIDGRATYVAVNGIIYDISSSQLWQSGRHEGGHKAGQDLTEELRSAPHLKSVIERFPVVGKVQNRGEEKQQPVTGIPLLSIIIMAFVTLLMLATFML